MRDAQFATAAELAAARDGSIRPRYFIWVTVKDLETGAPATFGYWSGDYAVDASVISGTTGLAVSRPYVGGINLVVGSITRTSDLTIQSADVTLSAIPTVAQQLIRGYDARLAKVEIHSALLAKTSRQPVAAAELEFLGEVDGAPIETGAAGGESLIKMTVRSDAISILARKNFRKRSHEGQSRRLGDGINKYSNAVGTWHVPWGQEQQNT